jgi:hypothetical protein|eukprot:evm.model.NODE_19561_length_17155_cov_60.828564.4
MREIKEEEDEEEGNENDEDDEEKEGGERESIVLACQRYRNRLVWHGEGHADREMTAILGIYKPKER